MENFHQHFSQPLLNWFDLHGRKNLPWKKPLDPYRIWISEIMLQQTQVQTVIPYFLRFIDHFPTVKALAKAHEDTVLALWAGLGYYSRARNLHKTAKIIVEDFNANFPQDPLLLKLLPGIGESTAAAIAAQAFNISVPILDANVKRVLTRFFEIKGIIDQSAVKKVLWDLAKNCMPEKKAADYTQAIMDLGALICKPTKPLCQDCPVNKHCLAFLHKTTSIYPEKKQKKAIPTHTLQFLLLHNDEQAIYLEKRPATGIWGGLWCLPHIEKDAPVETFIEKEYAFKAKNIKKLEAFKHTFTHYHLQLLPLSILIKPLANKICEPRGAWFFLSDLPKIGLPKPIHTIVKNWFLTNHRIDF